jgi:hypothetical protein
VLGTLQSFRHEYERRVRGDGGSLLPSFDSAAAVSVAAAIVGRGSMHFPSDTAAAAAGARARATKHD